MTDTTVRRPTIHPPHAGEGTHTLAWAVEIDNRDLADDAELLDRLCARFRAEVATVLARHRHRSDLDEFLASCRFSLADLRARDNRPAVLAARNELMWRLHRAGWPLVKIGRLLDRHHSTVLYGVRRHEADQAIARTRDEWQRKGAA